MPTLIKPLQYKHLITFLAPLLLPRCSAAKRDLGLCGGRLEANPVAVPIGRDGRKGIRSALRVGVPSPSRARKGGAEDAGEELGDGLAEGRQGGADDADVDFEKGEAVGFCLVIGGVFLRDGGADENHSDDCCRNDAVGNCKLEGQLLPGEY